jgi:hypothetical protein
LEQLRLNGAKHSLAGQPGKQRQQRFGVMHALVNDLLSRLRIYGLAGRG